MSATAAEKVTAIFADADQTVGPTGLALLEVAHGVDAIAVEQRRTNSQLTALAADHSNVMSGESPPCRHFADMRTRMWRFVAVALAAPVLAGVIIAGLVFFIQK